MIETLEKLNEELKAKKLGDLTKEIAECSDAAAITALLRSKEIEISADCAEKIYEMINKEEELSDEELAKTAGGSQVTVIDNICPYCGGQGVVTHVLGQGPRQLIETGNGYDCKGNYYVDYECPVCGEDFTHYPNLGVWED